MASAKADTYYLTFFVYPYNFQTCKIFSSNWNFCHKKLLKLFSLSNRYPSLNRFAVRRNKPLSGHVSNIPLYHDFSRGSTFHSFCVMINGRYISNYVHMYVCTRSRSILHTCANKDKIALALFQLGCVTWYSVAVTKVIPFYLVGISK